MGLAIFSVILAGATMKLLNKATSHRLSIFAASVATQVGGGLVAVVVLLFDPPSSFAIPQEYWLPVGANIILWSIAGILSWNGTRHTPVSIRESLIQSRLIFAPIIAAIFLGEVISLPAALGTFLIIAGIVIAVYRPSLTWAHPDMQGIGYVLSSSLLIAISALLDKHNVTGVPIAYYSALIYFGVLIILCFFINTERIQELRAIFHRGTMRIVVSGAMFAGIFYLLQLWLYQHLPLHIAYPLVQFSSAAALVFAIIFFHERDRVRYKIAGFCVASLGAIILRLIA